MGRKYLDDIGITKGREHWWFDDDQYPDDRVAKWAKEREIYGFDDRETWDLQTTFYLWLYERLMKYKESTSGIIDLNFHTFEYRGKKLTQENLIDLLIGLLKFFFSNSYNEFDPVHNEKKLAIGEIWALILPSMWW